MYATTWMDAKAALAGGFVDRIAEKGRVLDQPAPLYLLGITLGVGVVLRQADAVVDGVDEAFLRGGTLSGLVERGAVIHGTANDGQPQRDVHAGDALP